MSPFSTGTCFSFPFASSFAPRTLRSGSQSCKRIPLKNVIVAVASKDSSAASEIQRLTQKLEELRAKKEELLQSKKKEIQFSKDPGDTGKRSEVEVSATATPEKEDLRVGKHNQESRFLSFSNVDGAECYPRVVPLIADLEAAHPDEIANCPRFADVGAPKKGKILFGSVPSEYTGQVVAIPGVGAVAEIRDPIAVCVRPETLSENLACDPGNKVVLILERDLDGIDFDSYKFYAWSIGDRVRIGWVKNLPLSAQAQCLGRVICALMEEPAERRQAKSCWEEELESY